MPVLSASFLNSSFYESSANEPCEEDLGPEELLTLLSELRATRRPGLERMSRPKLFSILFTYSILSKHSLIENLRLPKGLSEAHFPGGFV